MINRLYKYFALMVIGLGALGYANVAQAVSTVAFDTNSETPTSFSVYWSLVAGASAQGGGINNTGQTLAARADFTDITWNNTTKMLNFKVTLHNLIDDPISGHNYSILGMGMYVTPNASSASLTAGTIFEGLDFSSNPLPANNFPGGYGSIDICVYAANNCSGGNINDGLAEMNSDVFSLELDWGDNTVFTDNLIILGQFALKFQTWAGSYEFSGCIPDGDSECGPTTPPPVPAPMVGLLFAGALIYMGLRYRRK